MCARLLLPLCRLGYWLFAVAILLMCALPCLHAEVEFAIGSIIRGFELPQSDAQGNLRSKIHGNEAIVISSNEIHINGMTIEVYEQGQLSMHIQAPSSTFRRAEKNLSTDQGIEITRPGFVMKAQNMQWSLAENKGTFEKNVRLTLESPLFHLP